MTLAVLMGNDGIITNAIKSSFYQEMSAIEEQKDLSKIESLMKTGSAQDITGNVFIDKNITAEELKKLDKTLKAEIIYTRNGFGKKERLKTKQIWENNMYECKEIFGDELELEMMSQNIYYISKESSKKKETYLYDSVSDVCFKIPNTTIGEYVVHSLPYAKLVIDGEDAKGVGIVEDESGIQESSDKIKSYEPNLNNFSYKTEIVYYSPDMKKEYTMEIKKFLEKGKPSTVDVNGETYTFADYTKTEGKAKIWANIKCTANNLTSYWTWIPRYAYKLDTTNQKAEIIYVDLEDKPMNGEGDTLPEGYVVHEAFKQKEGLKGIWFSKYQPSGIETVSIDNSEPETPDLSNFDEKSTKLVYYTLDGKSSIERDYNKEKIETKITEDGKDYYFYNYQNKIWANIKCTANNLISYWTWIPRYAYKLESGESSVILVDENDKPLDTQKYGTSLPNGYKLHEAFKQKDGLKGIWFSKYQPSAKETGKSDNTEPETPDLSNFDEQSTKLVYYTLDGNSSIERDYNKEKIETKITEDGKDYYFYNYPNKIWANVKCTANNLTSYWTWIPRYAYKLESGTTQVIFVDENNKPLDTQKYGTSLPSGYKLHEAFTQKNGLKGIWFSKYQPSKVAE